MAAHFQVRALMLLMLRCRMAKAIIRHGHTVDERGYIHYDETAMELLEADTKAGFRLDRRKNWAFVDGELCESISWTQSCSGCSCDCGDGYGCNHGASGCEECGYQGRVRRRMWLPYSGEREYQS